MTLSDLGNLGEFIASIGVIVSLVYLGIQIRQSSRIVKAATHHSSSRAWSELEVALATDAEATRILLEGGRSYAELSLEERLRYSLLMRAILHQHEDDFVRVHEGLIGAGKLDRRRRPVAEALAQPAARNWWANNAHLFSQDFQDFVARVLAA